MSDHLTWDDAEDLGVLLYARFPDLDPLSIRYTDLHDWVCDLDEFDDDPKASTEGKLEAIQMAWLDEYKDAE